MTKQIIFDSILLTSKNWRQSKHLLILMTCFSFCWHFWYHPQTLLWGTQLCQSWTSLRSAVSASWSLRTRATSCPLSQLLVLRVRRSLWTPTSGRDGKAAGTRSFISSSENGRTLPSWRPALPTPWPSWLMAWLTISCRPPWGWGYLLLDYLSFEKV